MCEWLTIDVISFTHRVKCDCQKQNQAFNLWLLHWLECDTEIETVFHDSTLNGRVATKGLILIYFDMDMQIMPVKLLMLFYTIQMI